MSEETFSAACPTCFQEEDFDSEREANGRYEEWQRRLDQDRTAAVRRVREGLKRMGIRVTASFWLRMEKEGRE